MSNSGESWDVISVMGDSVLEEFELSLFLALIASAVFVLSSFSCSCKRYNFKFSFETYTIKFIEKYNVYR